MGRGVNLHPLYPAYSGMVNRCTNPNNSSYHLYGGRGITVCDRWRYGEDGKLGFWCWLEDMGGSRPDGMTLDRIDNDGPYAPGNCQWSTHKAQRINQSSEGTARQKAAASLAAHEKWAKKRAEPRSSHCRNGHERTDDNTMLRPNGTIECLQCNRDRTAEKVPERRYRGVGGKTESMMKRPEGFYLHLDSKGNAEMRVQFRREDVAYIQKAIEIVDDILAMDEEEPRTVSAQTTEEKPDAA